MGESDTFCTRKYVYISAASLRSSKKGVQRKGGKDSLCVYHLLEL